MSGKKFNSSPDMLGLVAVMHERIIARTINAMTRARRERPKLTRRQLSLLRVVAELHHRYVSGVYVHDEEEEGRMVDCAQMLVRWHAVTQGKGEPERTPEVSRASLRAGTVCPVAMYAEAVTKAHNDPAWM